MKRLLTCFTFMGLYFNGLLQGRRSSDIQVWRSKKEIAVAYIQILSLIFNLVLLGLSPLIPPPMFIRSVAMCNFWLIYFFIQIWLLHPLLLSYSLSLSLYSILFSSLLSHTRSHYFNSVFLVEWNTDSNSFNDFVCRSRVRFCTSK